MPFDPKPLNSNINTTDQEMLPALTADGEYLIFTRLVGNFQEDLFISKLENGDWQAAQPMQGINTPMGK